MSNGISHKYQRRLPVGAEVFEGGVSFRVWAPKRKNVLLLIYEGKDSTSFALDQEYNGYFSTEVKKINEDSLYRYQLDNEKLLYPDPASRYQPFGPFGPSQIINSTYHWSDNDWLGVVGNNQVIYELHIGTFTQQGTWQSASLKLEYLAELGITIIEIMPITEFYGKFGWGYDGVNFFAPYHVYGSVEDVKFFINKAHRLGLAVILDVVYNHVGCEGNYLSAYDENYFCTNYKTSWGESLNFSESYPQVRNYFITNALYWLDEFHFDGLRFDAAQDVYDISSRHILAEMSKTLRKKTNPRKIFLTAENEPQDIRFLKSIADNGYGFDAVVNDDFHHSVMVRMAERKEAYYSDYEGKPQEILSSIKYGFLYQGQWYRWQQRARGTSALKLDLAKYINYLENHDQVANYLTGKRIYQRVNPATLRAMAALLLLSPQTPMIFQGQEFAASSPFHYFADHQESIAKLTHKGRLKFCQQFLRNITPDISNQISNPGSIEAFLACKLNHAEKDINKQTYHLYKNLLKLRRYDAVFNKSVTTEIDGAVINDDAFLLRFNGKRSARLLLVNFGNDFYFNPAPEPLIAPPDKCSWELYWSSEDPKYGGEGTLKLTPYGNWHITGNCLVVLRPKRNYFRWKM